MDDMSPGDIVQLKSGGPDMTVEDIEDHGDDGVRLICSWLGNERRRFGSFATETVKRLTTAAT